METGSETEEEDKLAVEVEEDALLNGTGSPASLTHPDASPEAESSGSHTKEEEEDDEDEMRDSGVEHIWQDSDMLSASVDGTGQRSHSKICTTSSSRRGFGVGSISQSLDRAVKCIIIGITCSLIIHTSTPLEGWVIFTSLKRRKNMSEPISFVV